MINWLRRLFRRKELFPPVEPIRYEWYSNEAIQPPLFVTGKKLMEPQTHTFSMEVHTEAACTHEHLTLGGTMDNPTVVCNECGQYMGTAEVTVTYPDFGIKSDKCLHVYIKNDHCQLCGKLFTQVERN